MGKKGPFYFIDKLAIESEEMTVDIFYTNVTWGEDLMQVISNHVNGWFPRRSSFWQKAAVLSMRLASPAAVLLLMITTSFTFDRELSTRVLSVTEQAKNLANLPISIHLLDKKLDLLIQNLEKPGTLHLLVPLIITTSGVILVVGSILMIEYALGRSFILLNDFTEKKHKEYKARRQWIMSGIIAAFVIGTLSSIFATKLTEFFFG